MARGKSSIPRSALKTIKKQVKEYKENIASDKPVEQSQEATEVSIDLKDPTVASLIKKGFKPEDITEDLLKQKSDSFKDIKKEIKKDIKDSFNSSQKTTVSWSFGVGDLISIPEKYTKQKQKDVFGIILKKDTVVSTDGLYHDSCYVFTPEGSYWVKNRQFRKI